jgi:CheY-like chemotaxis protein
MPSRPLHVLVVDDHPDTAESMASVLALHGFLATAALSGEEAVRLASADSPDVALVDLMMPGVDGCEVARRLRQLPRPPLLFAVTGKVSDGDRELARSAGFDRCLVKPVPLGELLGLLGECQTVVAQRG